MRTVTQRVSRASVTIEGELRCRIGQGLLVLVGFEAADTQEDIDWMAHKLLALRIFDDERGVMALPTSALPGATLPCRSTRSLSRPSSKVWAALSPLVSLAPICKSNWSTTDPSPSSSIPRTRNNIYYPYYL